MGQDKACKGLLNGLTWVRQGKAVSLDHQNGVLKAGCADCSEFALGVAPQAAPGWAKSWHQWGLFNLQLLQHYAAAKQTDQAQRHVAPAVVGFFRSVALGQADGAQPRICSVSRCTNHVIYWCTSCIWLE